jgi:tRNA(Ile)-lysidine synthase
MPFGPGRLLRPLLAVDRARLAEHARAAGLTWIEDPTNRDTALDRNYLRHEVVPALRRRWPGLAAAIGRSARLAAEATALLDQVARGDSATAVADGLIELPALRRLEPARQRNLIRYVLYRRGLAPPSETQLRAGLEQLLTAGVDRQPLLRWPGGEVRRYRERLYVLDADPAQATAGLPAEYAWDGRAPLNMGPVRGRLRLVADDRVAPPAAVLTVHFRHGGERLPDADRRHHKRLKKVFQERGVLPWMRAHVPLITGGGELLAVGDLWSSRALRSRIVWDRHAPIR